MPDGGVLCDLGELQKHETVALLLNGTANTDVGQIVASET